MEGEWGGRMEEGRDGKRVIEGKEGGRYRSGRDSEVDEVVISGGSFKY